MGPDAQKYKQKALNSAHKKAKAALEANKHTDKNAGEIPENGKNGVSDTKTATIERMATAIFDRKCFFFETAMEIAVIAYEAEHGEIDP